MKNKTKIIGLAVLLLVLLISISIFYVKNRDNNKQKYSNSVEISQLLEIQNFTNFYYHDKSRDYQFLSEHKSNNKKLKSIKVYRYSSNYDKMIFENEMFYDYKGNLIKRASYSIDYKEPSFIYYFYNNKGKIYLEISISNNKYDTIYTYRNFDKLNHVTEEIVYNIKRQELESFTTWDFKPMSNSVLRLEEITYLTNLTDDILPYHKRDMHLTFISPSEVKVHTARVVYQDSSYNTVYEDIYKLQNNILLSTKNPIQYEYNQYGDWVTMKGDGYYIKREMSFYKDDEKEIKQDFQFSKSKLANLRAMMKTLSKKAFENHREKHLGIELRTKLFNEGKYGKRIEKLEAQEIKDFTPALWYLVSLDSGAIAGFENTCYVAGYNTPIKGKDGFNVRCLAIYERENGIYKLRKESFNAIETFIDSDDDFSYQGFNEVNFSVAINAGEVQVNYAYMRGEASFVFAFQNGDWILVRYESNHRTCCQAESYSYDYKTKMYSAAIFNTTEDDSQDTTFNVLQNRPLVFMDSLNVMQYDYDETGLLIK